MSLGAYYFGFYRLVGAKLDNNVVCIGWFLLCYGMILYHMLNSLKQAERTYLHIS